MPDANQLVPNISLSAGAPIEGGAQGGGGLAGNPLAAFGQMATIQNQLNQARLFQFQFQGRQKLGQFLAAAKTPQEGLDTAMKDPVASVAVPEFLNTWRTVGQTELAMAGQRGQQTQSAIEAAGKGLVASIQSPENFETNWKASLAGATPAALEQGGKQLQSIHDYLAPLARGNDPEKFRSAAMGVAAAAGVGPDTFGTVLGKPSVQPFGAGGADVPGKIMPLSGGFVPAPGTTAGLTPGEKEVVPKLEQDMSDRAEHLPESMKTIDALTDAMGKFYSGGGTEARVKVAQGLQALKNGGVPGITDELINKVGSDNLSAAQYFNANIRQMMIRALKEAATGTGRVMRPEVQVMLDSADLNTDPKAMIDLFNQAKYNAHVGYDQSQKYTEYKQLLADKDPSVRGLNLSNFYSWYNRESTKGNTAAKLSFAPTEMGAVKTGPAAPKPGVTHMWDPAQKKSVPVGGQ